MADTSTQSKLENMFEFQIKDEFLPIYTHGLYAKVFNENAVMVQLSPEQSSKRMNKHTRAAAHQQSLLLGSVHSLQAMNDANNPFETDSSLTGGRPSVRFYNNKTSISKVSHFNS